MLTSSEESPHVVVDVAVVVACLTRSCGDKEGARGGEVADISAPLSFRYGVLTALPDVVLPKIAQKRQKKQ